MTSLPISRGSRRCIVPGCKSSRKTRCHIFPKDERQGKAWLAAVRNPMLDTLTYKEVYEKQFRVCTLHFREEDYPAGMRKFKDNEAIPTLLLPCQNDSADSTDTSEKISIDLPLKSEKIPSPPVLTFTTEFSPTTYRNPLYKPEENEQEIRKSSIRITDNSSTPTKKQQQLVKRKLSVWKENVSIVEINNEEASRSNRDRAAQENVNLPLKESVIAVGVSTSKSLVWKSEEFDSSTRECWREVLQARRVIDSCKTKNKRYSNRIKQLAEKIKSAEFCDKISTLSTLQRNFIEIILRNADRDTKGRRYTTDERLLCLSIYKRSPAAYRYLSSFLPLPCPATLKKILVRIQLDTGVTKTLCAILEDAANRITDAQGKACILMWDEVSLKVHVQHSAEKKKVVGFEDWGTTRTNRYANHALVFMLKGLKTGWKIPVSYHFCADQTTSAQLVRCIKDVVRAVTTAGFNIVATVCDQGSSNQKAIKSLQFDTDRVRETKGITKYWTIIIDDVEFVPLFDAPHILKCFRNNLLTKDLEFDYDPKTPRRERKFSEWDHVVRAYQVGLYAPRLNRMVPNLTQEHVVPETINKMSVKLMMQVSSRKLSSFMYLLARSPGIWDTLNGPVIIPGEARNTAFILQFLNDVADGINGDHRECQDSRRIPWSDGSYHDAFFADAIVKLKKMRWVHQKTHEPATANVPCLKNLRDTLQGLRLLWRKLREQGFSSFNSRNVNKDPLENFFGSIKSHDFRSTKPTCFQFESIFKAILITNLTSKHTPGYNCEDDHGRFLSSCIKNLVTDSVLDGEFDDEDQSDAKQSESDEVEGEELRVFPVPEKAHIYSNSRDLVKTLQTALPSMKSCSDCIASLNAPSSKNPGSTRFRDAHLGAKRVLARVLPTRLSVKKLDNKAIQWLTPKINFTFISCDEHKEQLCELTKKFIFEAYCRGILAYLNCVLSGRITPRKKNVSPPVAEAFRCYIKTIAVRKRYQPTEASIVEPEIVAETPNSSDLPIRLRRNPISKTCEMSGDPP